MDTAPFPKILESHPRLSERRTTALTQLTRVKKEFTAHSSIYNDKQLCVYCAGSLGREEVGKHSDLDIFVLAREEISHLDELEILATVININNNLGYDKFSNDGRYLKVYSLKKMLATLGEPWDDSENLFTARMLLLLESKPVYDEELYTEFLSSIINHYFRDKRGKRTFKPLFLINDILRYWRTLCLNYERVRDDIGRPWRKKNINLKFSRMLTVFGTILPLIAKPISDASEIHELVTLTPHQRLAQGLDMLFDPELNQDYQQFLDNYESFLSWKEQMGSTSDLTTNEDLYKQSRTAAKQVSDFFYKALCHAKIDGELRKFLMI